MTRAAVSGSAILALVALALAVRLPRLGRGFFDDELFSMLVAVRPLREIFGLVAADFHPPLSFWLLHVWATLGRHEAWMRVPSVSFSVGAVVLTALIIARFAPARVAILTAALVAVLPAHVEAGTSVRMYAQLSFLTLLATWCLLQAIDHGRAWWGAYAASAIALLYTHNIAPPVLACLTVWGFVLAAAQRETLLRWAGATVVIGLAYLPWLSSLLAQVDRFERGGTMLAWVSAPTPRTVMALWYDLTTPRLVADEAWRTRLTWPLAVLAAFGAAAVVRRSRARDFITAAAIAPMLIVTLLGLAGFPVFVRRALMFAAVPLYFLAVEGWAALRRPWQLGVGAIGVAMIAIALAGTYRAPFEDWRATTRYVAAHARPTDLVATVTPLHARYVAWYWDRPEGIRTLPVTGTALASATGLYVIEDIPSPALREVVRASLPAGWRETKIQFLGTMAVAQYER